MINFVFLSQLSHFYALTLKHSTLIYSHSCYSHRFWLPVHTLFSMISVFCVSFYRFPCTYLKRKGKNLFIRSLNTGRCYVCSNCAFVGVFLVYYHCRQRFFLILLLIMQWNSYYLEGKTGINRTQRDWLDVLPWRGFADGAHESKTSSRSLCVLFIPVFPSK